MTLSIQQLADFHRDGFTLIKGVFSPDEMAKMQQGFARLPALPQQSFHLYELPGLEQLWADPRLVEPARQILGEPLTYYFDGHLLRYCGASPSMPGRHLHHDAKGTPQNIFTRMNAASSFTYPILRIGIYMQNTLRQSGGIKVVPGSHLRDVSHFDQSALEYHNVESEPGDVVMFTHRLLHTPFALRPAYEPVRAYSPIDELTLLLKPSFRFLPMPEIRETIFLNYAGSHELSDIHIKHCALLNEDGSGLPEYLISEGYLEDGKALPVSLRVDGAIVETMIAISSSYEARDDRAFRSHLMDLLKLCRFHRESSPHFPFFVGDIPDNTPETAVRIYEEITPRLKTYRAMIKEASHDLHMGRLAVKPNS